jgi:hypothetical protein
VSSLNPGSLESEDPINAVPRCSMCTCRLIPLGVVLCSHNFMFVLGSNDCGGTSCRWADSKGAVRQSAAHLLLLAYIDVVLI